MVTIKSETPCLSEATEVINEISVNLLSQHLIHGITTSFDDDFDPLIMNSRTEVEKFEPGTIFENTINEIRYNHLKSIASAAMSLSDITFFNHNFEQICMNSSIELEKFEPEPTFKYY